MSSKGSRYRREKKFWLVIGGERGKCRPSWIWVFCDWSRGGEKEAIFAQIWVVSIMGDVTGSGSKNTGNGSQNVKRCF